MCGVEGAQGHAGLANFSNTLLGTPVRQVEGTRCDPCFVHEGETGCLHRFACGRHAGCRSERTDEKAVAGTREGHGDALGHGDPEAARDSGSVLEQDKTRVQLRSLVLVSA